MKKTYIIILLLLSSLILNGCTNKTIPKKKDIEETTTQNIENKDIKEEKKQTEPKELPEGALLNWEDDLPKNAQIFKSIEVDFEGDKIPEVAVFYKNPKVIVKKDDIREIHYVKIYQKTNNYWLKIKEDETTNKGGIVDNTFLLFSKINLGNDNKEELLISKGKEIKHSINGYNGYYIFGQTSEKKLEDLAIPRGYLQTDKLLKEGDQFQLLDKIEVTATGIQETYHIACESRDWYNSRFGYPNGGFCRKLVWVIPYNNDSFQEPEITKNEVLLYDEPYELPYFIKFKLPAWLTPSKVYKSAYLDLTAKENHEKYIAHFGVDLQIIKDSMFNEYPESFDSKHALNQKDIDELLNLYCKFLIKYGKQCTISNNIATLKDNNNLIIMLKLVPNTLDNIEFVFHNDKRNLNYFDEAVMKSMIESFEITGW